MWDALHILSHNTQRYPIFFRLMLKANSNSKPASEGEYQTNQVGPVPTENQKPTEAAHRQIQRAS